MTDSILEQQLRNRKNPIEVIQVGLGFMGFGFLSNNQYTKHFRIPLVISRRPEESKQFLLNHGVLALVEDKPAAIRDNAAKNIISVSDNLDLIKELEAPIVFEVTGTVDYGTQVALKTLEAKKHLVTMNPELQATVGTELKKLFDKEKLIITDVVGDQPGSLARLIASTHYKGFKVRLAGNMKRYMDVHATQAKMKPWAEDKGLAVRQTVSFTDGTKQSIEMNLVSNYYGMTISEAGMRGPKVDKFDDVLKSFDWNAIPAEGIVDYMIGINLFPGVFVVAEHTDPQQQKYLRYLNMGDGPRYVLFDSYHLCHLEVGETIARVALFGEETINNGLNPTTKTITIAKQDLVQGQSLDGIGGDTIYGSIRKATTNKDYLPIGVAVGSVLKRDIPQDAPIRIEDVELPTNAATKLLGLV
ncbi:hypothetical protein KBC79_02260 [Candidatus Woesebacteria bacterium]|nr:hypothetical protein [Candidatus Woesebacteria bacterium]